MTDTDQTAYSGVSREHSLGWLRQPPLLDLGIVYLPDENRAVWSATRFQSPRIQGFGTFIGGVLLSMVLVGGGIVAGFLGTRSWLFFLPGLMLLWGVLGWFMYRHHAARLHRRRRHGDILRMAGDGEIETMFGRIASNGCVLRLITGRTRPVGLGGSGAPFHYGHAVLMNGERALHVGSWLKGGREHQRALTAFTERNGLRVERWGIPPEEALEEHDASKIFVNSVFQ